MDDLIKKVTSKHLDLAKAYKPLEQAERIALGSLFLEMFEATTKLIEFYIEKRPKRQTKMVRHTDIYFEFLDRYKDALGAFRVAKLPMLVEPRPWSLFDDGGYLMTRLPISTVDRVSWPQLSKHMHRCVLGAINHLQKQPMVLDHVQAELLRKCWELGHEMGSLPLASGRTGQSTTTRSGTRPSTNSSGRPRQTAARTGPQCCCQQHRQLRAAEGR